MPSLLQPITTAAVACEPAGQAPSAASCQTTPGTSARPHLTTDELAARLGLHAQSIRKRYSQTGSYFQLQPIKLPNRRLLWPADALERLIKK